MIKADLHMHSFHSSDGEWQVTDILRVCKEGGLSFVSITDHNLVTGTAEAMTAASSFGMQIIPGIEIDCSYKGIDLHLLGYHIDWQSADFKELETGFAQSVMESFEKMIINLKKTGIDADPEEVILKANGRLPNGELIAEVLLENKKYDFNKKLDPYRTGGVRSDMPLINFYLDFFAQDRPAYVKIDFINFSEAVELIKKNHGVAIVAHPGLNLKGKEETIIELLQNGADGLEVFNNYHNEKQMRYFAEVGLEKKVLMTCGSDFHGKTKPLISPGIFHTIAPFEQTVSDSIKELAAIVI